IEVRQPFLNATKYLEKVLGDVAEKFPLLQRALVKKGQKLPEGFSVDLAEVVEFLEEIAPDFLPAGSGWSLWCATGINNAGQIVGYGINPKGFEHAVNTAPTSALLVMGPTIPSGTSRVCF